MSLSSTRLCSVNAQFLVQGQKTAFKLIICDPFLSSFIWQWSSCKITFSLSRAFSLLFVACFLNICDNSKWGICHQSLACYHLADGADGSLVWWIAMGVVIKQLWTTDKGSVWPGG